MAETDKQSLLPPRPTRKRTLGRSRKVNVRLLDQNTLSNESLQVKPALSERTNIEQHPAKKGRKRRTVMGAHPSTPAEAEQNEYERQREERIKRNQDMLRALNIAQLAQNLQTACMAEAVTARPACVRRPQPHKALLVKRETKSLEPTRKSARQGGREAGAEAANARLTENFAELDEHAATLSQEDYLKEAGIDTDDNTIRSDGHFHGWVCPEICARYGVAGNAAEAWEQNGGGKFTFKIDRSAIPASLKSRGWSDARAFSSTQLQKNPNTFFYRHTAPHEQQAQGEWTQEEHDLFLQTARSQGVGDKWGLFASYIPQRVGYQCSAYYREVIIPAGLVLDARFRMTRSGKALFNG
ncbi:hypothetical protein WJX73_005273 [Symbiochloris irregularis]|uniref:Myb-like domain-containing protein n=1 Tax=Symbiochloris irregularis TaxID=706552 RepID=A0AAW1PFA5_9CHLO